MLRARFSARNIVSRGSLLASLTPLPALRPPPLGFSYARRVLQLFLISSHRSTSLLILSARYLPMFARSSPRVLSFPCSLAEEASSKDHSRRGPRDRSADSLPRGQSPRTKKVRISLMQLSKRSRMTIRSARTPLARLATYSPPFYFPAHSSVPPRPPAAAPKISCGSYFSSTLRSSHEIRLRITRPPGPGLSRCQTVAR